MLKNPTLLPEFTDLEVIKKNFVKINTWDDVYIIHSPGFIKGADFIWNIKSLFWNIPGPVFRKSWVNFQNKKARQKYGRHHIPDEITIRFRLIGNFPTYGIVDSIEQFKSRYSYILARTHVPVCVFFQYAGTPQELRESDPNFKHYRYNQIGWRWHKQGEYMGDQDEPTCEYYADEDGFEKGVWFFNVCQVV
jgi:hypothetical protein